MLTMAQYEYTRMVYKKYDKKCSSTLSESYMLPLIDCYLSELNSYSSFNSGGSNFDCKKSQFFIIKATYFFN